MIKAILVDFARTLIFPKDKTYMGGINDLHKTLSKEPSYKLFDHFELNAELVKYLKALKESVPIYMFTSEIVQEDPSVRLTVMEIFTKVYSAHAMGMSKKEPETYKFIASDIRVNPNEVLFIDDSIKNVEAATIAGMQVIHYKDNTVIHSISEIVGM